MKVYTYRVMRAATAHLPVIQVNFVTITSFYRVRVFDSVDVIGSGRIKLKAEISIKACSRDCET